MMRSGNARVYKYLWRWLLSGNGDKLRSEKAGVYYLKGLSDVNRGKLILVLGGARSGKSEFAEKMAGDLSPSVIYVATAAAGDGEMARRIENHQLRRPPGWQTVEETRFLPEVLREHGSSPGVILVDCLTVWLTNLLLDEDIPYSGAPEAEKESQLFLRVTELADRALECRAHVILVANEVGMGIVPAYPLGRLFRDVAGRANRHLAQMADEVYFVAAGLAVELKSIAVNSRSI
jgi:adenosylcobinamide kinase/adenosylcobinamide-phosphate guanylyltransferase